MPKKIEIDDFLNKEFGYLLIKKYAGLNSKRLSTWECQCKCGAICIVSHNRLLKGETKSCGCLRREMASKNLINKRFGDLIVLKKHGYTNVKNREVIWECLCDCGNKHLAKTCLLCNGHVQSCGCKIGKKINNLAGMKFGGLNVISYQERKNNETLWLCKCEFCGKEKAIVGKHLVSGKQKSCGCRMGGWKHGLTKDKKKYYKYLMSDPARKLRQNISGQIRKALFDKGGKSITEYLPYSIEELKDHLESLWEPWMNWDNYGGRSNCQERTWWIDHITPQSFFSYQNMDDPLFLECWALKNLMPLDKKLNMQKGAT